MKKGFRFKTVECPYCSSYMVSTNWFQRHINTYHDLDRGLEE